MNIIIWLSLGFLVALTSTMLAPRQSSVLGTLLLGGLGALLGGMIGAVMFNIDRLEFSLPTLLISLSAALTLVTIQRSLVKN